MRRPLTLLALSACLLAVVLPGCGGDDESSGPLEAGLAYVPADSPFAVAVDTDLEGDQYKALDSILAKFPFGDKTIAELIAEQVGGADSDVDFERDVRPILGNTAVLGATDIESFLADDNDESFVAALQAEDGDALDDLIEKSGAQEAGETAGATKYEDGGSVFAVDGDVVVLADSERSLDRALERADGDERLTQHQFEAAFDTNPNAALAGVYTDLRDLITSSPDGRTAAERIPWVGALRTLGVTLKASGDGVTADFVARTDAEGLSEDDLPMAAGDRPPPVIARPGELGVGLRDLAQVIRFAETAGQSIDPSGFGDYERAKRTLDSRLGISIDDDLIGQLNGDVSASITLDGKFAVRAQLRDAGDFERTLTKIVEVLPTFLEGAGASGLAVEEPSGRDAFYRLTGSEGEVAAFGVADRSFVVASDTERAGEIVLDDPEEVDGARGALAASTDAQALVDSIIVQLGPLLGLSGLQGFGAQLFTGPLEDLNGSVSIDTGGLRGRTALGVE
jgi:hypothetical protein